MERRARPNFGVDRPIIPLGANPMDVPLTPELESLVRSKVESGGYLSAGEGVGEALRLLEERDRLRDAQLERLKREVHAGLEQLDRGESTPLNIQGTLARVRARRSGG